MLALEEATATTHILVVEDDATSARLLCEMLGTVPGAEFTVESVSTSEAACTAVEHNAPDLVLLDLGLPDAQGLEALLRLQSCVNEIPVIILTGNGDERVAVEALAHGAEDYLVKAAVDRAALIRSIRYAIERHRSVRELARVKRQLETANETLERMTVVDPLTDLLNRRGLQRALTREIDRVRRFGAAAALLIDLDDFRQVNTAFGHAVGDIVLKELARRLKTSVRAVDHAGRLGGDEFLVLLPETDPEEVVVVAERIRLAIHSSVIQHTAGTVSLTASVAVLMLTPDTPSVDQVLARMHQLLTRAKTDGKNRVVFERRNFDDTDKRMRAQSDMCTNLARGQHLLTLKQPIYRLADETPVGFEFLSRYSDGVFEVPDNFFRLCSERNMLTLVDHFCLRNAVAASALLPPHARFHVNLFPTTLLAIPPEHLLQTFPKPLPRDAFCVEISEQQIIGDPSYLQPVLRELRAGGLRIAIDDVGFGSSCLESLVSLEPEVMKIDKRCVIGLSGNAVQRRQLKRYLAVAAALGSEVVAEGVENEDDLAVLRDEGVDLAQGFYWGRPS